MAVWPTTLPPPATSTLGESPPNNQLATSMDKGPGKVRRRTAANVRTITFSMRLTPAQCQILDNFFVNTTFSGTDTFSYTHPRTLAACTARFTPGKMPSYAEQENTIYNANVSLDIMP